MKKNKLKNKLKGKKINFTAVLKALSNSSKFSPEKQANIKATAELLESQQGAVYIEYAFLVAFIAMAASGAIILLGHHVTELFNSLAVNVDKVEDAIDEIIHYVNEGQGEFLTNLEVNTINTTHTIVAD